MALEIVCQSQTHLAHNILKNGLAINAMRRQGPRSATVHNQRERERERNPVEKEVGSDHAWSSLEAHVH